MPTTKPFKQVDVFTSDKFKGNPVAVFFQGDSLTTEEMQTIANWTNLSETTFVLPPTNSVADYKLRIFTPSEELPFAGHPTVGSCHAVIESGFAVPKNGKLVQECAAGLVDITVSDGGVIQFKLPYYKHVLHTNAELNSEIAESLGLKPEDIKRVVNVDDGPIWFTIQFNSGEAVFNSVPDYKKIQKIAQRFGAGGFSCFGPYQDGSFEARNFFFVNDNGIEDPVCGSGAAANGSVLAELSGFEGDFLIRQGRKLGRDGRVTVSCVKSTNGSNGYSIFVGGNAVTCMDGLW